MDSQSLSFLWEASVVVEAPELAERLVQRFGVDLARSNEIHPAGWARRPLARKLGQQAAGLADPWL